MYLYFNIILTGSLVCRVISIITNKRTLLITLDNLAFTCRNLVYFFILLHVGHTHARSSDVLKLISIYCAGQFGITKIYSLSALMHYVFVD